MIMFQDGPAKGQNLMLKRAPRFLRVVEYAGFFDGLDQIEDIPNDQEWIHVYELQGAAGVVHMDTRGKGGSYWFPMASYALVNPQPADEEIRENPRWQNWCIEKAGQSK